MGDTIVRAAIPLAVIMLLLGGLAPVGLDTVKQQTAEQPRTSPQNQLVLVTMSPPTRPALLPKTSVQRVQSRVCRSCRRDCYAEFRVYCGDSDWCRRQFTLCMRSCWEEYCR